MKNMIFYCLLCLFYSGCIPNKKEEEKSLKEVENSLLVVPKENISSVLDSFVRVNNCKKNSFFEIYVDKQSPQDYLLMIYSGKQSLTYNDMHTPIMHAMVSGFKFDIYSGVENYFEVSGSFIPKNKKLTTFSDEDMYTWVVKDSAGVITVKDYFHAYPFMPLPRNTERYFNPNWWK